MHFKSTSVEETRKLAFDIAESLSQGMSSCLPVTLVRERPISPRGLRAALASRRERYRRAPHSIWYANIATGVFLCTISICTVLRTRRNSMTSTTMPSSRETEFPWWSGGISSRKRLLTTICCLIFPLMNTACAKSRPLPSECGLKIFFRDRAIAKGRRNRTHVCPYKPKEKKPAHGEPASFAYGLASRVTASSSSLTTKTSQRKLRMRYVETLPTNTYLMLESPRSPQITKSG